MLRKSANGHISVNINANIAREQPKPETHGAPSSRSNKSAVSKKKWLPLEGARYNAAFGVSERVDNTCL